MFSKYSILLSIVFIGTVDRIIGEVTTAELTGPSLTQPVQVDFYTAMFPCAIEEGDLFYIHIVDGVTEIRCGEPD